MEENRNFGALGDGDQGICFIKQMDEFLSPDGFKRAALKDTNTKYKYKYDFLKTKLLNAAMLDQAGSLGSKLSGQLKKTIWCFHSLR